MLPLTILIGLSINGLSLRRGIRFHNQIISNGNMDLPLKTFSSVLF